MRFRRKRARQEEGSSEISPSTVTGPTIIDLTLDSDKEDTSSASTVQNPRTSQKKIKAEPAALGTTPSLASIPSATSERLAVNDGDDDEVEIVDPTTLFPNGDDNKNNQELDEDEELRVVGTKNHVELVHMRQHCTKFLFQNVDGNAPSGQHPNQLCCDNCYCYVCDCNACDCKHWQQHCHATDTGPNAHKWKHERAMHKARTEGGSPSPAPTLGFTGSLQHLHRALQAIMQTGTTPMLPLNPNDVRHGPGPLEPNTTPAPSPVLNWVQCRYCKWYTQISSRGITRTPNHYSFYAASVLKWCLACGRVASNKYQNELSEEERFQPDESGLDVCLGTKRIPFRLHAHDPRQMQDFQRRWEQHGEQWTPYSAQQMQRDLFAHRITAHPHIQDLVDLISPFAEADIPNDGTIKSSRYGASRSSVTNKLSAVECDAILLEDEKHALLLRKLAELSCSLTIRFQLSASWNTAARRGTLVLKTFVPHTALNNTFRTDDRISVFLGLWFGIFPCPFGELSRVVLPHKVREDDITRTARDANIWWKEDKEASDLTKESLLAWKEWKDNHNMEEHRPKLSLTPSVAGLGGTCPTGEDLETILKNYFSHCLPDLFSNKDASDRLVQRVAGLQSQHRPVFSATSDYIVQSRRDSDDVFLLGDKESVMHHLRYGGSRIVKKKIKSLTTLLAHAENLGHDPAPFVEGLTVELLPFQLQSLQWAIERETIPGGIQSLHWAKVPLAPDATSELYFNPMLGMFSSSKPNHVRGGFICESMGLGKTVISLALILSNPAPALPVSGSKAKDLAKTPKVANGQSFWKTNVSTGTNTSSQNLKRGRFLSRGTLVVCNVSLVGQWIEEAKSKLQDPGLVYSYHGANRKRDPRILAKNEVVVTTYETLASDLVYHARKANSSSYCPPVEQVRWWRIIADECHVLRSRTTKAEAVMQIEADHKWLVSGTPFSTSLNDISNQLSFLQINHPSAIMEAFRDSFGEAIGLSNNSNGGRRRRWSSSPRDLANGRFGKFTWFIRSIMCRHTQEMKYKDTDTTLMSLPPKEETVLKIDFTEEDKKEYQTLEEKAQKFYRLFNKSVASKAYLRIMSSLLPVRVACAGGQIPLEQDSKPSANSDDSEDELDGKKPKKTVTLSDYAFKSKLDRLIKEMVAIREEDPQAKTLIFSQFTTTLQWLQQELPRHGFQFRTLSGDMSLSSRAKALRDFQKDPPTTIFLLSMRAGAVGINLTAANRVFLLEPCFNPALEQQAIGRVWRLGQQRNVKIYRMIMKDSVEERMQKLLEEKYGNKDVAEVPVGSLKTDKASMVAKEFDLLFGLAEDTPQVAKTESPDAPETVASTHPFVPEDMDDIDFFV